MNLAQAINVIVSTHIGALHANRRAIAIEMISAPGIGKSSVQVQAAAIIARMIAEPVGVTPFFLTTITSPDVRGFMIPTAGTEGRQLDTAFSTPPWQPTRVNTIVVEPDGAIHPKGTWTGPMPRVGILNLDEFGQADEDIVKPAAELVLNGEVGNSRLPVGWRVIATSNRMKDRSGVKRPMMFIVNRRMELFIDSDMTAFIEYQQGLPKDRRLHHMTLSFAQAHPGVVFTDAVPDGTGQFCTPRSLCMLDGVLRSLQSNADASADRLPMDAIARECANGLIGEAAAHQFFIHLKYHEELPSIESIMRDPLKAKLPPSKDAQMVTGYMLADKIDEGNADHLMSYLVRLQFEMQVLAVRAMKAKPEATHALSQTEGFAAWLRQHSDVLLASRA